MNKQLRILIVLSACLVTGAVQAQDYPVMERVADKVVQKYQTSTCEQLWQEKQQGQGKPKPAMEERAVALLKSDAKMREAFFNKVSAPVVKKMFECGMIP